MEVTGSSVPVRESRSAPSVSRRLKSLTGLLVVCSVVGLSYAVFQTWKLDQTPKVVGSTATDDVPLEVALARPAEPSSLAPVRLAADGQPAQVSTDNIAQVAFETAEATEPEPRVRQEPPVRAAWLTGTIEAIDEKIQPAGRPMPTFDNPLRQPPVIDP